MDEIERFAEGLLRAWAHWVIGDDELSMGDNVLADMIDTSDRSLNPAYWKAKSVNIQCAGLIQSRANVIATYHASYGSMTVATASRRSGGARVPLSDKDLLSDGHSTRCYELNQLLTSRMGAKPLRNVILVILNPAISVKDIAGALEIPVRTLYKQVEKARKLCAMSG